MIEGTRQYRPKKNASAPAPTTPADAPGAAAAESSTSVVEAAREAAPLVTENSSPLADAGAPAPAAPASPARREWFRSLVPTLGNGLVEILRASNNLKRDLTDRER